MKKQIAKIKAETAIKSDAESLEIINRAPVQLRKGASRRKLLIEKASAISIAAKRGILPAFYWKNDTSSIC